MILKAIKGIPGDKRIPKGSLEEKHLISNHQIPKLDKTSWNDAYKILFIAKASELLNIDLIYATKIEFEDRAKEFIINNEKKTKGHSSDDIIVKDSEAIIKTIVDLYQILDKDNNFNKFQKACVKHKIPSREFLHKHIRAYQKMLMNENRITNVNVDISMDSLIKLEHAGLVEHEVSLADNLKNMHTLHKRHMELIKQTINEGEKRPYRIGDLLGKSHGKPNQQTHQDILDLTVSDLLKGRK